MTKLGQATHFTEYEMVKRGFRDCDVYQLNPRSFDVEIDKVAEDKLFYRPILRSKIYQGFGHRHYPSETIDENTFIYGVVGKTWEAAEEFKKISTGEVDHKRIGELLGYPACCSDWFLEVWLTDGCVDPMFETATNTPTHEVNEDGSVNAYGNPMFNRLLRYWAFQVIPYFTHSYDCEPSKEFADTWWKIMHEFAPEESELLLEVLNTKCTWSLNNMIIFVEHPLFRGCCNGYWYPEKRVVHWVPE